MTHAPARKAPADAAVSRIGDLANANRRTRRWLVDVGVQTPVSFTNVQLPALALCSVSAS